MIETVLTFLVVGLVVYGLHYVLDGLYTRAPSPDGLAPGEALIASTQATLKIDGAEATGYGYAYLTDRRLVWTPSMTSWHVKNAPPGTAYTEPVIVEMPDIRKVDARFRWGGSGLIVETNDIHMDLEVRGRSLGSWERYVARTAPALLPSGQPVARGRRRYPAEDLLAVAPGSGAITVILVALVGVRILQALAD